MRTITIIELILLLITVCFMTGVGFLAFTFPLTVLTLLTVLFAVVAVKVKRGLDFIKQYQA